MGKFKDHGNPALALVEECAEVIQVVNKLYRFNGNWDEIPDDNKLSRWDQLEMEIVDVFYQWERLKAQRKAELAKKERLLSYPKEKTNKVKVLLEVINKGLYETPTIVWNEDSDIPEIKWIDKGGDGTFETYSELTTALRDLADKLDKKIR
jgi:hypothetical protein